ncbi:MAG TPA: NAD(P)/FAD-dependent oxidoreductase, partial [Nevskiaceae bacterium]|nr:NAD(P)/FAD-dependent oxidoreductase [Nevskiaceae bacterium]
WPHLVKGMVRKGLLKELGPDFDIRTHFTPRYNPWDQRMCLVPDADLFQVLREGRADIVTDHIETFTPAGIRLKSGKELAADIIVTATGLNLQALGGAQLAVDGQPVNLAQTMSYKGMMLSGVPNMALALGYTNASWTLKVDLTCDYVCRLLNHMRARGYRQCTPRRDASVAEVPFIDFSSGYILRSIDKFPRQGSVAPWKLHQNYAMDILALRYGKVDEPSLQYAE